MTPCASEEGNTLLSPDEQADLIPNLGTKDELNEWERQNILEAYAWAFETRNVKRNDPLAESYVQELHRRMFDQTWKWAGRYRTSEKNIGIPFYQVQESLAGLLGNVRYWLDNRTFGPDEIAIRLHHRLTFIHPFANGNGRHARLMADLLSLRQGGSVFSWGGSGLMKTSDLRKCYIEAQRAADENDIGPLLEFARS